MISNDEFNNRYANTVLAFKHYWKYTFTFEGTAEDGAKITAKWGGHSDAIYRYEVTPDTKFDVDHYDCWNYIKVEKDGQTIYTFTDW